MFKDRWCPNDATNIRNIINTTTPSSLLFIGSCTLIMLSMEFPQGKKSHRYDLIALGVHTLIHVMSKKNLQWWHAMKQEVPVVSFISSTGNHKQFTSMWKSEQSNHSSKYINLGDLENHKNSEQRYTPFISKCRPLVDYYH